MNYSQKYQTPFSQCTCLSIHLSFKFNVSRKGTVREALNVNCKFLIGEDIHVTNFHGATCIETCCRRRLRTRNVNSQSRARASNAGSNTHATCQYTYVCANAHYVHVCSVNPNTSMSASAKRSNEINMKYKIATIYYHYYFPSIFFFNRSAIQTSIHRKKKIFVIIIICYVSLCSLSRQKINILPNHSNVITIDCAFL